MGENTLHETVEGLIITSVSRGKQSTTTCNWMITITTLDLYRFFSVGLGLMVCLYLYLQNNKTQSQNTHCLCLFTSWVRSKPEKATQQYQDCQLCSLQRSFIFSLRSLETCTSTCRNHDFAITPLIAPQPQQETKKHRRKEAKNQRSKQASQQAIKQTNKQKQRQMTKQTNKQRLFETSSQHHVHIQSQKTSTSRRDGVSSWVLQPSTCLVLSQHRWS